MAGSTMGSSQRGIEAELGEIGTRLRRLRHARALTQEVLARSADVSADTITKVENGLQQPHPTTIRKLAAALDVEVEMLTGGVPSGRR